MSTGSNPPPQELRPDPATSIVDIPPLTPPTEVLAVVTLPATCGLPDYGLPERLFATDRYPERRRDRQWLKDVDTLYVPMCLDNKSWVGLVINLQMCSIHFLAPDMLELGYTNVEEQMRLIACALPYILNQFSTSKNGLNMKLTPFKIGRSTNLYTNKDIGDSGPVSIKMIELHALGAALGEMVVENISSIRKQLLMDVYDHYIVALSYGWYGH